MRLLILIYCCICLSTFAVADELDLPALLEDVPIKLSADSSDFNYNTRRLIFKGLKIEQGNLAIEADLAETDELDFADGLWTFSGNVTVQTETATLYCDDASIHFTNHELARAELLGSPARFEQATDESGQENTGEANRMIYQTTTGILELHTNARFVDGKNEISGDQITYNVLQRNLSAGSGDSGPVTILIEPPQNSTDQDQNQ